MQGRTFADACLRALNDELEGFAPIRFTVNPHARFLNSVAGSVSLEDVRRMVAFKRKQWEGTRYQAHLNPSTLLSPYHLESYIAESKMPPPTRPTRGKGVVDDELASYAS